MIKFYRKIRKKLLSEGKTGKYLKYAVGEIILVVIGILIALQINNWNINKQNTKAVSIGLTALHKEIETNINYLNRRIEEIDHDIYEIESIIYTLNSDTDTISEYSLNKALQDMGPFTYLPMRQNAYQNMITSNLIGLIKDETLKLNILGIEAGYQIYEKNRMRMFDNWEDLLKPYYIKHMDLLSIVDTISTKPPPKRFFIVDKTRFLNNKEFTNILIHRSFAEKSSKWDFNIIVNHLTDYSKQIETYMAQE